MSVKDRVPVKGVFEIVCTRNGKVLWTDRAHNAVVDVGANKLLDVHYRNQTQIATWYVGLVDNSGWTAFAAGDTMGSHTGWTESQDYNEAARVTWSVGAASSRTVTNSSTMDFTINATKTLKGLFVTSVSTKGGTTGTLNSTASFSGGTKSVSSGDVLHVTYTITC